MAAPSVGTILSGEPSFKIKSCLGSPQERGQALEGLQVAKGVVLDLTAIATVSILDALKPYRCFAGCSSCPAVSCLNGNLRHDSRRQSWRDPDEGQGRTLKAFLHLRTLSLTARWQEL